jgi:steroid delta-isomerase
MAAPDPDHIRNVYQRYVELFSAGDADAVALLYAEDATVEDPIGSPLHQGRDAIRKFYEGTMGPAKLELTGPVRVAGNEAAGPMCATVGDGAAFIDIIDVMTFDDDGLVRSMRAYWSQDAIRTS